MRSTLLSISLALVAIPAARSDDDKKDPKLDLVGAWTIRWNADPDNVNALKIAKADDKIEGTYVNDLKETCKVTGRLDRTKGTLTLTIKGQAPDFEIKCDGTIKNAKLVEGKYLAYGSVKGEFRLSRGEKK